MDTRHTDAFKLKRIGQGTGIVHIKSAPCIEFNGKGKRLKVQYLSKAKEKEEKMDTLLNQPQQKSSKSWKMGYLEG